MFRECLAPGTTGYRGVVTRVVTMPGRRLWEFPAAAPVCKKPETAASNRILGQ